MPATAPTPSGAGSAVGGANGGGAGGGGQEGDGRKGGTEGGGGYAGGVAGGLGAAGGRCENSYWVHSLGPAVSNAATSYQMASTRSCKTRSGAQLYCRHHLDSAHCFILRHLPTTASSCRTSKPTYTLRVAQTPPPSQLARQYVSSSPSIAFAGRPLLARGCIGGMNAPEQSDDGYTCSSRTVHGFPTPAVAFDGRTRHAVGATACIAGWAVLRRSRRDSVASTAIVRQAAPNLHVRGQKEAPSAPLEPVGPTPHVPYCSPLANPRRYWICRF